MLTALDFWHLVEHIIPVYVLVIVGYVLTRFEIIEPVHSPGISKWVSTLGVPMYVFHLLAFNDPYQTSMRLVGADVLSKALVLIGGCLWWRFCKCGSIEGVIGFFMLATLPNTVLIGDALLVPLYGEGAYTQVVTIIFLQSLVWYNLCICLYELRVVLLEEKQNQLMSKSTLELEITRVHHSAFVTVGGSGPLDAVGPAKSDGFDPRHKKRKLHSAFVPPGNQDPTLERTISAPARFSFSRSLSLRFTPGIRVFDLDYDPQNNDVVHPDDKGTPAPASPVMSALDQQNEKTARNVFEQQTEKSEPDLENGNSDFEAEHAEKKTVVLKRSHLSRWALITFKMINRVKKVPLTYASVAGLIYSLFAFKYNWNMPYPIRKSVELISEGALGLAIFLMGMAWARSGRLISCGFKALSYGIVVRFLVGPIIMIIAGFALRLQGTSLKFAILQAVIPQGVISFVLAKEYGLDVPLFNTAVVFQLVIFIPIVLAWYYLMEVF
ncbi:auxin efflux carrier family protein [Marchantia polymorpha subsp. ruderalis]|uniref:Auxin efflux carrier component n=2 Tax=Marchantia polymorpha TaxID=3197 RepID=A0AAF6BF43_MARPO|nr:hypothetical protein MARPO_0027s0111 [Marchantia polymorpha]BBN10627.1 hypothetical protein Mp_5g05150 [Marchantia polymorpha subsp. ruderalis]|eukprot:PTQ43007.1 hypothetical protein MARPO_0027s0111 [Marchantia polymorpha]